MTDRSGTTFRLWSTVHDHCELRLLDDDAIIRTVPMRPVGGHVYEARIAELAHGARYLFVLDGTPVADRHARSWPPWSAAIIAAER